MSLNMLDSMDSLNMSGIFFGSICWKSFRELLDDGRDRCFPDGTTRWENVCERFFRALRRQVRDVPESSREYWSHGGMPVIFLVVGAFGKISVSFRADLFYLKNMSFKCIHISK